MKPSSSDLLIDLAKLLRKYGPDEFEDLAKLIGSAEFTGNVSKLLLSVAEESRRHARTQPPPAQSRPGKSTMNPDRTQEQLEITDPERASLLAELKLKLTEGGALPRLSDVLSFAKRFNLPGVKATSRDVAVRLLLKSFSRLSTEQVRAILEHFSDAAEDAAGLKGWTEIILPKRNLKE
jgi:hypothetical protein